MTVAIAGKTAVIQMAVEVPPVPAATWNDIVEVYEIGELPIERETYDVTSHNSSFYREYIMGLYVTSTLTMSANYEETQYDALFALVGTGVDMYFRLVYPDTPTNSTHEFMALVSSVSPVTPLDDRITYNLTLTVTGAITRGVV